ncbi:1,2-phenylacetyl-CoA epoxidase subunit PaaC [Halostella sp. PRR32]|uniref:1,2-phenylacetyl-CoA epoxidase subunit PaaC n=1 Tax=Halostella sp. PRR32 TaxID=3098147 RepID=UPI002B1DE00D|nr:1,2-phenylacetyl-CoA epoxidase subunit PaaC [Halostella sp. PRR32]
MSSTAAAPVEDLDDDQREAVQHLLYRLADDEFVAAERYTEWQVRAPTLESDLALSNIAQDELGHARLWYDLLQDFGYDEPDLLFERDPETFRHSTMTELPFEEGDWSDAIVRTYLYDVAEDLRLEALEDSSYGPIRDRVGKIQSEEDYHLEHAESWLDRLASDDDGQRRLQEAVDRLFPYALTLFEPTDPDVEARIVDNEYRTEPLDELGEEWLSNVVPKLESYGLDVPISEDGTITSADLPPEIGRDGNHTDDWEALYDDFTQTYRDLGRTEATTLMEDPS